MDTRERSDPSETQGRMRLPARVDAVVVGGGHAGMEAAWVLARCGHRVALITMDAAGLGRMSCNPAIGGIAKGQLAREIDALGGMMGRLIDRAGIHFRMLNRRKGPAVRSPRGQADKQRYTKEATRMLLGLPSLLIVEGQVTGLAFERSSENEKRVTGVLLDARDRKVDHKRELEHDREPARILRISSATDLQSDVVILAPGTFLRGSLYCGLNRTSGGRRAEPPADELSAALLATGLELGRLKTGTPPRIFRDSIDVSKMEEQRGDEPPPRFSFFEEGEVRNLAVCHLTRTNERTHDVIRRSLDRSPLYGGLIRGVGPRYCPSIEDKVVRFPDRASHHLFLEPEGLDSPLVYPNGISTSLPLDVQEAFVHTIEGMEDARIAHPGYAVEYDFLLTSQIDSRLGVRGFDGLYSAGQINGTSGYEEAAAQGIVAGLNACAQLERRPPFVLRRDQAYIGVLIDDLITKVPAEPYRMFTSQSEYRLLLRQDNADFRLSKLGYERGLLKSEERRRVTARWEAMDRERERLRAGRVRRAAYPMDQGDVGKSMEEVLRRPEVALTDLEKLGFQPGIPWADYASLEADIKYEGYIPRLLKDIQQRRIVEEGLIPSRMLDNPPQSLSREAREKLQLHRPQTLGQASRIPGITPCDVSLLMILIHAGNDHAGNDHTGKDHACKDHAGPGPGGSGAPTESGDNPDQR